MFRVKWNYPFLRVLSIIWTLAVSLNLSLMRLTNNLAYYLLGKQTNASILNQSKNIWYTLSIWRSICADAVVFALFFQMHSHRKVFGKSFKWKCILQQIFPQAAPIFLLLDAVFFFFRLTCPLSTAFEKVGNTQQWLWMSATWRREAGGTGGGWCSAHTFATVSCWCC